MQTLSPFFSNLTIICLLLVSSICTWGVFSHQYEDNLMQRIGMSITAVVCIAIVERLFRDGVVFPSSVVLALGITCYAIGTAWKQAQMARDRAGKPRFLACLSKLKGKA